MKHLTDREIIAHHESAHAVIAIELGQGILDVGIDIDRFEETGGIGSGGCRLFVFDSGEIAPSDIEEEQRRLAADIDCSGIVLAAGPAADARLRNEVPWDALLNQKSDLDAMKSLLERAGLSTTTEIEQERLRYQLALAVDALNDVDVWKAVEALAAAVLDRGSLGRSAIEGIVEPMLTRP